MTGTGYRRKDNKRACSLCGHVWFFKEMTYRGLGRYYCPDDAAGMTAEEINKHNARAKPLLIKNAKAPLHQTENSSYSLSEGDVFRLVMDFAGVAEYVDQNGAVVLTVQYVSSVAQAGLYLSDLVNDGNRPELVAPARAKMLALADQLLALQYGSPTGPSPAEITTSMLYGAMFGPAGLAFSLDTELAGKLFLRAYAASGGTKYIDGADRCAMWLRGMQRTDAGAIYYAVSGGSRLRVGGFANSMLLTPREVRGACSQADMGLSFLADLKVVRGGSYQYGVAPGGDFALTTTATIDEMIAEAIGFYFDGTFRGQALFSTTAPKAYFDTPMADGSGSDAFANYPGTDGSWYLRSAEFATGLRSLYDYEGATARVRSLVAWLRGFTYSDDGDPTFCPAQYLTVTTQPGTSTTVNDGTIYDLEAGALLAPVTSASGFSIREFKDVLNNKAKLTADSTDIYGLKNGVGFPYASVYPGPTGQLNFDGTAPMASRWVEQAAALGGIYRLGPRALDSFPDGFAAQIGSAA